MKMGIIGSGASAILAAHYFDEMGADVTLFQRSPLGGNLAFLIDHFPEFKINFKRSLLPVKDYFESELIPVGKKLEEYNLTKSGDVLRIHKRFLHPDELVPNRTRLHDLFRVVYSVNPKDSILKQLEENPDLFKQLGEEVINSLHHPVESFMDFDIVIQATGFGGVPTPMGAGKSFALNEINLRDCGYLFYEKDIFKKLNTQGKKSLIIVGEGISQKLALLKVKDWLFEAVDHEITWVTYKDSTTSSGLGWLDDQVETMLSEVNKKFENDKVEFEKKLRAWRDLEDYEKVKVPRPIEPKSKIQTYEGYDVTSVDKLLDRESIFMTIESSDFREAAFKKSDMLTVAADAVLICRGYEDVNLVATNNLLENEPGFYLLNAVDPNEIESSLVSIKDDILKYFSKA